jgi:hypothetical protein
MREAVGDASRIPIREGLNRAGKITRWPQPRITRCARSLR